MHKGARGVRTQPMRDAENVEWPQVGWTRHPDRLPSNLRHHASRLSFGGEGHRRRGPGGEDRGIAIEPGRPVGLGRRACGIGPAGVAGACRFIGGVGCMGFWGTFIVARKRCVHEEVGGVACLR